MIKRMYLLFIGCLLAFSGYSQTSQQDWALVAGKDFHSEELTYYNRAGNDDKALQNRRQSWLAQYNPVSLAFKGALLGYQRLMSQQLARSCPYEITCSNFSKQSIQQFGIVKGVFLSADRIMRCNRIGLLDVHPLSINPQNGTIVDSPSQYQ